MTKLSPVSLEAAALALLESVEAEINYLDEHEPDRLERSGKMAQVKLAKALRSEFDRSTALSDPSADDIGKFSADAHKTSRTAALSVYPRSGTQRQAVLDYVVLAGEYGATDEEMREALGQGYSSQGPRRLELVEGGWLRDSGRTRLTAKGNEAIVWVLTETGAKRLREAVQPV